LDKILEGIPNCEPGKTYIVVSKSQNGKTTAAMDVVVNHLGQNRNGLYLNAGRLLDIVPALQRVLNTTVDGTGIVRALVSALGISQAGKNKGASLLFLDEVVTSARQGEGLLNASFVKDLFMSIASEENVIGVILTSKEEVADHLLGLNGGKIRPFPGFAREDWEPYSRLPTGWTDIDWTVGQLQALLVCEFGVVIEGIDTADFLVHGMTPGDAVSHVKAELTRRLVAEPTAVV
jgi:hypothetical protein